MVEKKCFAWPLYFKSRVTKIHQTFCTLHIATPKICYSIPWAHQLLLCNYRMMTAGLSYYCQQVIACRHLTVTGFLFERKAHCVSAQVIGLFLSIHEVQHKSANNNQSLCRFFTLVGLSLAAVSTRVGICADAWHIFPSLVSVGQSSLSVLSRLLPH